jgi:hypothetical protein
VNVIQLSVFDLKSVSGGSIIISTTKEVDEEGEEGNNSSLLICVLSSIERKLRYIDFSGYLQKNSQIIQESNMNLVKETPLTSVKGLKPPRAKSPSAVRVTRTNSSLDEKEGKGGSGKGIANEDDINNDNDELDFFRMREPSDADSSRSTSPREYDENGNENNDRDEEQEEAVPIRRKKTRYLLADYSFDDSKSSKSPMNGKKTSANGSWEAPLKNKQGQIVNQAVTFHTKIKSSGYGQKSNDLFQRKLELKRQQQQKQKARSSSAPRLRAGNTSQSGTATNSENRGPRIRVYPMDCEATTTHQSHWDFPDPVSTSSATNSNNIVASREVGSPIFHLAYSSDATRLAVGSQNPVLICLKLPRTAKTRECECENYFIFFCLISISVCFVFSSQILLIWDITVEQLM